MVSPPKQTYIEDFKERLIEGFENSSDWFTVQQEEPFASKEFISIDARINYVISNETGEKMSDDYKLLWFKDVEHEVKLGTLFYFNENYWLVINTEKVKSLATSITVKRCNNTLRWMDKNGGYYNEPCTTADALIRENRDYSTTGSAVVNVSGVIEISCQFNERTNTIKANQRFLFGNPENWTCYKVFGAGVNNLNLMNTEDLYSAGIVRYSMGGSQYNALTDDLVNGIADVNQYLYTIELDNETLELNIGKSIKLIPHTYLNGESTSSTVVWESMNESIASVSSDGTILALQDGDATIRVSLENNDEVYAEVLVHVVPSPVLNWEIRTTPVTNYILEGDTTTFTCYLYKNNVQSSSSFTFTIMGSVPTENYEFSTSGSNAFILKNKERYFDSNIIVRCVCETYQKDLEIELRGAW
jgi:hypothetical protein